ncbi:MAG: TonB-dependent receptor plug domain-containing protein, partial [Rickettsiales bacterium]
DTLAYVPGVYAQKRFGEEVRLSIRGSGLSRGFHLRGLTLLQDGIPFNLADGSADFQEADSLAFQRLEVFKGGNALQYGSTTLGGAVNMVTKTGNSDPGHQLRLEAGSFNTYRAMCGIIKICSLA